MFEYFVYTYGSQILLLILCILFGSLGFLARRVADRFLTDESKRKIVRTVVMYVEQVFKDLHGQEKMDAFLAKASELLTSKGIPFTLEELKIMAEAVLAEFNKAFEKPIDTESTADAVRCVDGFVNPDTVQPDTETVNV